MTDTTTNREPLYLAAINCPHEIDHNRIVLHYDDAQPGNNALAQLDDRLAKAAHQVPPGFALVPIKVDNAMIDAANNVPSGIAGSPPHWQWVWDAMLAAAPTPLAPPSESPARDVTYSVVDGPQGWVKVPIQLLIRAEFELTHSERRGDIDLNLLPELRTFINDHGASTAVESPAVAALRDDAIDAVSKALRRAWQLGQTSSSSPVESGAVAWANVREDGVIVGLSQHSEDIARWQNPRPLYTAPPAQAGEQRAAIIEECCAAIKAEDDKMADEDYMLDSDDCIRVIRALATASKEGA